MSTAEWADTIQAAGVIAALLFAGYELHIHTREQRYKNYLDAMAGFAAAQVLMIQTPALHAFIRSEREGHYGRVCGIVVRPENPRALLRHPFRAMRDSLDGPPEGMDR